MEHTEHHDHDHSDVPSDVALRVKALELLLVEKGLVDPAALDVIVETYEYKAGPHNGAAWWPAPGPILPTSSGCYRTVRQRSLNSAMPVRRAASS